LVYETWDAVLKSDCCILQQNGICFVKMHASGGPIPVLPLLCINHDCMFQDWLISYDISK
jgi:hypothetical protein